MKQRLFRIGIVITSLVGMIACSGCSGKLLPGSGQTASISTKTAAPVPADTTAVIRTTQTQSGSTTSSRPMTKAEMTPVVSTQVDEIIFYKPEAMEMNASYHDIRITDKETINRYLTALHTDKWQDPNGYELATLGLPTVVIKSSNRDRIIIYQGQDPEYGYVRSIELPEGTSFPDTGLNRELQLAVQRLTVDLEEYIIPKTAFSDSYSILNGAG